MAVTNGPGFTKEDMKQFDEQRIAHSRNTKGVFKDSSDALNAAKTTIQALKRQIDDLHNLHQRRLKEWKEETEGRLKRVRDVHLIEVEHLLEKITILKEVARRKLVSEQPRRIRARVKK